MKKDKISVVLLARNEGEKYLKKVLRGVNFCDEIVVVVDSIKDSESAQVAKKFTDKIFARKFDNFANQKSFALKKARFDWVLFVDSDEVVSGSLKNEIKQAVQNKEYSGYEIPFKHIMFGKWIRHSGWYPSWRLTLFLKNKALFSRGVHEQIDVKGKTGRLKNHITHYNYDSIHEFIEKMNKYTDLEATELDKAKVKFSVFKMFFRSNKEFLSRYFKHKGFLDGIYGLVLSILMAYYWAVVYIKLWEKQRAKNQKLR